MDGGEVVFEVDGKEFVVAIDNIDKAKLVPDWAALGLAPAVDKSGRDARPGKQKKHPGQKPAGKKPGAKASNNNSAANGPSVAE